MNFERILSVTIGELLRWAFGGGLVMFVLWMTYSLGYSDGNGGPPYQNEYQNQTGPLDRISSIFSSDDRYGEGLHLNYYTILIGSYEQRSYAYSLKNRLATLRIKSRVIQQGRYYYVIVGKYRSLQMAQRTQSNVARKGYEYTTIVPPRL